MTSDQPSTAYSARQKKSSRCEQGRGDVQNTPPPEESARQLDFQVGGIETNLTNLGAIPSMQPREPQRLVHKA